MKTLCRIVKYLRFYKKQAAIGFLGLLGTALLSLAIPKILGLSVDRILQHGDFKYLAIVGVLVIVLSTARGIGAYFQNYSREAVAQFVSYRIRNEIYDHLQSMSFAYHDRQQTGQLMSKATADVESVRWFISLCVFQMTYVVLLITSVAILLFITNWQLALASLGLVPFVIWRAIAVHSKLRNIWQAAQEKTAQMTTVLQESMSGVKVVKVFSRQDYENEKFSKKARSVADEQLNAARVQASNTPFINAMFTGLMIVVVWYGGHLALDGKLTPGQLASFVLYLALLQMPVQMLGMLINFASRAVSSGERIFEIIDAESPVEDKPAAKPLTGVVGGVVFDKVAFSYKNEPVLRDINLDIKPGQIVALLGTTGSGKTSLVHLIPRFYDVTGGRITIDGTDVRDVTQASLRKNIGIVQQDVFLFSDTIRNNIAYGSTNATDEQVEWAAKLANIHNFISGLPNGYKMWVGERGLTLSGGQRQRVAIARTLLLDPRILILDDSTSSVDTKTEHEIRQALVTVMKNRTTFLIAHRLSTVKNADLILVLDRGVIIQRGTHEQLVKEDGPYKEIYRMQQLPEDDARKVTTANEVRS